jgi:hypothetical protein
MQPPDPVAHAGGPGPLPDPWPDASPWASDSEQPSSPSGVGHAAGRSASGERASSGVKPSRIAWTPTEHTAFLDGLGAHGRNWRAISKLIGPTRSLAQVRGKQGGREGGERKKQKKMFAEPQPSDKIACSGPLARPQRARTLPHSVVTMVGMPNLGAADRISCAPSARGGAACGAPAARAGHALAP